MAKFNNEIKLENGKYPSYAFPGGYPLYYLTKDCGILCPKCVNDNTLLITDPDDPQWFVTDYDINYEDDYLICDNCNKRIPSAYAENENEG